MENKDNIKKKKHTLYRLLDKGLFKDINNVDEFVKEIKGYDTKRD